MKRESPKTQQTRPDHHALVRIEKPIYGGAFLARVEGKAMFVPLTLPGEEARVRIVEEKRSYASAEPEEIIRCRAESHRARLQAVWPVRRLPVSTHGLRIAAPIQRGDPARNI